MAVWITNMSHGVSVIEHHPIVTAAATDSRCAAMD
jgi:hypothetical protein